jgi:hypothetical protein
MTKEHQSKGNWFTRHKVLTVILVIVAIAIIGGAAGGGAKKDSAATTPASPVAAPAPPAAPKFDISAFYDQVQNGMTKAQVTALANGKAGENCSESAIAGYGTSSSCSWSDGAFGGKLVMITFKDDAVQTKSKTGF